jgi:hypothetical protein
LYNLKTDPEETSDLAGKNPELANNLSKQLFSFLNEAGARFPELDPEYNHELEQKHLERIVNERLPQLEKQRLDILSKDYDPGNNWWGSKVD